MPTMNNPPPTEKTNKETADFLDANHYLGRAARGFSLYWDDCVMVFSNPSTRRLPAKRWLELTRWCLIGEKNTGSQRWSSATKWLRDNRPEITTIISYSDPDQGHTGALYRACNWLWAPTWHRLRPPPSGNGKWQKDKRQSVKDRWIFPLRKDEERPELLRVRDSAMVKKFPYAEYQEPKKGIGGGDFKRWNNEQAN